MPLIILDAAPGYFLVGAVGIYLMILGIVILVEAGVFFIGQYGNFKKSFLHAVGMNLLSFVAGTILYATDALDFTYSAFLKILILGLVSVLSEGILILFIRGKTPLIRAITLVLIANVATYLPMIIYLLAIGKS